MVRWCLLVLSTLVRPRTCRRRWLLRARNRSSTWRSATLSPLTLGPWHTRTQDGLLRWRIRTTSWQRPCSYHHHPVGGTSLTGQLAKVWRPYSRCWHSTITIYCFVWTGSLVTGGHCWHSNLANAYVKPTFPGYTESPVIPLCRSILGPLVTIVLVLWTID